MAIAAQSPNLSGKWNLNKDKSEFSRGGPDSMTAAITDDGKKIRMVQTVGGPEGERTSELNIERGAERVNHLGDREVRTKLRQDGARLLEESTFSGPQGTLTRKSTITISTDGKTLTMDSDYESAGGGFHERIVLDKVD
jgi:hypothetical protein